MANPLISVVVTTYNHGDYVPKAISDLLEQTYDNYQVVLVNDASPDNTDQIIRQQFGQDIKDKKLIYIVNKVNKGQPRSREIGIDNAPAEIILFCDSDERYDKEHLAKMFAAFSKGYDCVNQHTTREIDQNDQLITKRLKGFPGSVRFKLMLFGLTGSDIITTKKVIEQVGGFSVSGLKYGEDWAFLLAVYTGNFKLDLVRTHTTLHREHQGAMTSRFDWHPYRASTLQPYMDKQLEQGKITLSDRAIFKLGGCFNAPYKQVPKIIGQALKDDWLVLVKNPAFFVYALWNIQRRAGFHLGKKTAE